MANLEPDFSGILDDRYEMGEVLGRGGMGQVRAAHDRKLRRQVAIKVLSADLAAQAGVKERFEAEARAAGGLNHPNIVSVFDTGEHDGVPYLVMERLSGRTLADELSQGPLDPADVRRWSIQVLSALGAAHDAGIVHRDIKPGNILVTDDGNVKVADFGIAKSAEGVDLTQTGTLLGTPAYLAPERLAGGPTGPQSDIYALGVVMYEALSGERPFSGDTPIAIVHSIQNVDPPPLAELRPGLDSDLVEAVQQAMDKDPSTRIASAREMAAMLDPNIATMPGGAVPSAGPPAQDRTAVQKVPAQSRTQVLEQTSSAPAGKVALERSLLSRYWLRLAALALGLIVLIVLVSNLSGGPRNSPDPTSSPTGAAPMPVGTLPAPLEDALDDLDKVVEP